MARIADPVTAYARAVVRGREPAGAPVRQACERHLRDLAQRKATGLEWRLSAVQKALSFFSEMLVLVDGRPFDLLPFQQFIVGSLFGWYNAAGFRRYRDAYVETGKGSGKTPLAAGIGLYGLVADGEPDPEVYTAATTRDQASIAFRDAVRMVEDSAELRDAIKSQVGSLTYGRGVLRPLSAEHRQLDGKRPHIAIIDELHEHPTALVVDKLRAGTKNRRNALIFRITNSGFDRTSPCWQDHEYSLRVLAGTVPNESWFAYVCALDEGDDPLTDEACWGKVNPGLGNILPLTYLREQVEIAKGKPSAENLIRRLNFCQWTEQQDRWLDMSAWDRCADDGAITSIPVGADVFAGLDAASRSDLTALSLLFPREDGSFDVRCRFWLPEETLAAAGSGRTDEDRRRLQEWARAGLITTTSGNQTDYDQVERDILEELEQWNLRELAFDRWNITQLVTHLKDALGEARVIDYPQTFPGMSAPAKELERLVAGGKIRHGGHPVLRWMASNVAIKDGPDGTIKPDRQRSKDKIDGIVALVMALGRATVAPAEPQWDGTVQVWG